MFIFLLSW